MEKLLTFVIVKLTWEREGERDTGWWCGENIFLIAMNTMFVCKKDVFVCALSGVNEISFNDIVDFSRLAAASLALEVSTWWFLAVIEILSMEPRFPCLIVTKSFAWLYCKSLRLCHLERLLKIKFCINFKLA